jgi:hypothetical protein
MAQDARRYHQSMTHYLYREVAFNTPGIASANTVEVGTLPQGAQVLATSIAVTTAFNAGSTNVLVVGIDTDDDALVAAGGVDETAVGVTRVVPATLAGKVAPSSNEIVYARYTQTGTAASAGAATIVVEYVVNNG